MGDTGRATFRYLGPETAGVSHRWLNGHFTHAGWGHLALNIAGLLSIWALYAKAFREQTWHAFLFLCPIGISLGFTVLSPQISYYVGLSGVLHGMLAAGALSILLAPRDGKFTIKGNWEELIVLLGLWAKIAYEQTIGAIPMTASIAGDTVVVNAHLYGAIIGTLFALTLRFFKSVN